MIPHHSGYCWVIDQTQNLRSTGPGFRDHRKLAPHRARSHFVDRSFGAHFDAFNRKGQTLTESQTYRLCQMCQAV
jgi:hypothetical protein